MKGDLKLKRYFFVKMALLVLCLALTAGLISCGESELPPDAQDPAEALVNLVDDFWDSEIYENAIFDAFYNSETASEELKKFNQVNALNAKYKIFSKSRFEAETISIDKTSAVVRLFIKGINFGEYAEVYLSEFDRLQSSVIIVGNNEMLGLSAEEVSLALRFMPINAAEDERVTYREFETDFELRYKNGEWEIRKPAYKDGRVFLELFAEHITTILNGRYKFRPGIKELEAEALRANTRWWGYGSFKELIENRLVGVIYMTLGLVMVGYCIVRVLIYYIKKIKSGPKEQDDKDYERMLLSLAADARKTSVKGLSLEIRNSVGRQPGRLDPRTETAEALTKDYFIKKRRAADKRLLKNKEYLLGQLEREKELSLEELRLQNGWTSDDPAPKIKSESFKIESSQGEQELIKYETPTKGARRCVIFFHDSRFFGGRMTEAENRCRLLTSLLGGVVFSVIYPSAPENRFPMALDCCFESVEWVYENADKLGVDANSIGVAGDGMAAGLAMACVLRARDEKKNIIKHMTLICPAVTPTDETDGKTVFFDESAYDIAGGDPYVKGLIYARSKAGERIREWYLKKDADLTKPYVRPMAASMKGLPTTLVIAAEYDYLRLESEELSRRLKNAGVPSRHIRYGGVGSEDFKRLGYAPQAEDALREIVRDLRRLK